jgi:hypothetical protein
MHVRCCIVLKEANKKLSKTKATVLGSVAIGIFW